MKKVMCLGLLVLMVMPLVFASVEMSIKTVPDHRISVIFRNPGELATLDSFHKDTGDGNIDISSLLTKTELDIQIILKTQDNSGKFITMLNKKFESVSTNNLIKVTAIPGEGINIVDSFEGEVVEEEIPEEEVVEEEIPEEEVVEEEIVEEEKEAEITGEAVGGIGSSNSKTIYYIVGVVLLLLIGFYLVKFRKKMGKKGSGFKVVKFGDNGDNGDEDDKDDYEDRVSNAEKKLEEAQKALSELR
jgi:hypothetical protein